MACGNYTEKDAEDELYAGTGDAVTLRILVFEGRFDPGREVRLSQYSMDRSGSIGEAPASPGEDGSGRRRHLVPPHQSPVWLPPKSPAVGNAP